MFLGCHFILVFLFDPNQRNLVIAFGPFEEVFEGRFVKVVPANIDPGGLIRGKGYFLLHEINAGLHPDHAFEALRDILDLPEFVVQECVSIVFQDIRSEPIRVLVRDFEHIGFYFVLKVVLRHDLLVDLLRLPE